MAMANSADHEAADLYRCATHSDVGTERAQNEDACGLHVESPSHALVVVADGVSGVEGGGVASQTAVEVLIGAYRESPAAWGAPKRLYRAAQQANIEIHDRALVVTELRGMSTTLTAIVLEGGVVHGVHVGDSRLYLVREGQLTQKTKDHTVAAERRRMGFISSERMRDHPERSILTRSLGRELIAAIDRLSFPIAGGDKLVMCSDGLYNVLSPEEIRDVVLGAEAAVASRALVDTANARGTPDNVTAAVVDVVATPPASAPSGWRAVVTKLLGSG